MFTMSAKLGKKARKPGKGKNKKRKHRNKLSLLIGEDDKNDIFSSTGFSSILLIKEDDDNENKEQQLEQTILSQSSTQITPKAEEYIKSEIKENTIEIYNSVINGEINNETHTQIDIEIQEEYTNSNTSNTSDDTVDNIEQIQNHFTQTNDNKLIDSIIGTEMHTNKSIDIDNKNINTFEFEFKYNNNNNNNRMDMLLMHAKDIIEEFLKEDKPELEWRISEYLCRDEIVHLLLSYISRLPSYINVRIIHSIYINENNIAIKWINNSIYKDDKLCIDKDKDKDDNDRHFLLQYEQNNIQNIKDIIIKDAKMDDNDDDMSSSDDIDKLFER
eukprot:147080_1